MKCQVTSDTTRKVMISREVKVANYKEICGGEKMRVYLGYNNYKGEFEVENNKLLQNNKRNYKGERSSISRNWEILNKFFSMYNIEPVWLWCHQLYGSYDKEQGAWTGCAGKVLILNLITERDH